MLLDMIPLPSTWKKVSTVQRNEYRVIPMEDVGNMAGGYLAFETKDPANEYIVGVGSDPLSALQDLLNKLNKKVVH